MSSISADKLVSAYIKIRNQRKVIKEAYDAEDAELETQLKMISDALLGMCTELGADSIKTPFGTAFKSSKTRYWTNDWGSMYDFIKQHDAMQLMEQRIHQTNMKQFLEEHPEELPMGLNADSQTTITVRKR